MGDKEKNFALECYNEFILLPRDTDHEKIRANREKCLIKIKEFDKLKKGGYKHPAVDLVNEWQHYFDPGFVSLYKIEDLRALLKEQLADMAVNG